ncbi:hypothetical protein AALO_G00301890 [Alosa alosa]|uniref:Transposable element P transposase-like GTP-binding insertion domain-containing protein n=1 Tax=Alosa alosa TaxID=278164 RepID=A0AAV6FFK2_9TELE|nr:hypothetical protein AALO_G00301890 [Alosa alosa]
MGKWDTEWRMQVMKVELINQTFSHSVADALQYCNEELHLPQFQGLKRRVRLICFSPRTEAFRWRDWRALSAILPFSKSLQPQDCGVEVAWNWRALSAILPFSKCKSCNTV